MAQVDLLEIDKPWRFNKGWEFPGAEGALDISSDGFEGYRSLSLTGDFTEGGAYVGADLSLEDLQDRAPFAAFEIQYRSVAANRITVRLGDETGQTHQRKIYIDSDGEWRRLVVVPQLHAGGEHWGGANDAVWHGKVKYISVILPANAWPDREPSVRFSRILAYDSEALSLTHQGIREDFESAVALERWDVLGPVGLVGAEALEGDSSLAFDRSENESNGTARARSEWIKGDGGTWLVSLGVKADLDSADNSYRFYGRLRYRRVDSNAVESREIFSVFGKEDWEKLVVLMDLPADVEELQFEVGLEKAWGRAWFDDLTLALVDPEPMPSVVSRIELSSARLGNLFYPDDALRFEYEVRTSRLLSESAALLNYTPNSFRGSVVGRVGKLSLSEVKSRGDYFAYEGSFEVDPSGIELGRYHSLEVLVSEGGSVLSSDSYGFALLPEASNNSLGHAEVPFTVRNWDSRIGDYLRLARRMGIRVANLWGGWRKQAPYEPWLATLSLAEELDLQWIVIAASKELERGDEGWDRENLYGGMYAFLEKYADRGLYAVSLGNEPHGDREKVSRYMEGYKAVYEAVKDFDSSIEVIASSSGPNEDYWREGIGAFCDSYDFHKYESYREFPQIFARYEDLMERFDARKPIRSTEIGLNSQGMPRYAVACDMAKKVSTFFAEGGATVGWFTILYPDREGRSQNSFGSAHNMFASQYNRYNAKLDAVAYFHLVNAVGSKRFVEGIERPDGLVLHRYEGEGETLIVAWNDESQSMVRLPLEDGVSARRVAVDGQSRTLRAGGQGLAFVVGEEPSLLLFPGGLELESAEIGGEALAMTPLELPTEVEVDSVTSFQVRYDAEGIARIGVEFDRSVAWELRSLGVGSVEVSMRVGREATASVARALLSGWDSEGRCVSQRILEVEILGAVSRPTTVREPGDPRGLETEAGDL